MFKAYPTPPLGLEAESTQRSPSALPPSAVRARAVPPAVRGAVVQATNQPARTCALPNEAPKRPRIDPRYE